MELPKGKELTKAIKDIAQRLTKDDTISFTFGYNKNFGFVILYTMRRSTYYLHDLSEEDFIRNVGYILEGQFDKMTDVSSTAPPTIARSKPNKPLRAADVFREDS